MCELAAKDIMFSRDESGSWDKRLLHRYARKRKANIEEDEPEPPSSKSKATTELNNNIKRRLLEVDLEEDEERDKEEDEQDQNPRKSTDSTKPATKPQKNRQATDVEIEMFEYNSGIVLAINSVYRRLRQAINIIENSHLMSDRIFNRYIKKMSSYTIETITQQGPSELDSQCIIGNKLTLDIELLERGDELTKILNTIVSHVLEMSDIIKKHLKNGATGSIRKFLKNINKSKYNQMKETRWAKFNN